MNVELKNRIDNWLINDVGVEAQDASLLLIDCRTDMLVADLKLLSLQTKLQCLLNELKNCRLNADDINVILDKYS